MPLTVWALTTLHVLVLVSWSVLMPIYDAPDEPQHVDMVRAVQERGVDYPGPEERGLSVQVEHSLVVSDFSASVDARERILTPVTAVMATPRHERPSFSELGPPYMATSQANQMPQHPPLFYALGALLLWLVPEHLAFDQIVGALRLFDVLLMAPLPLLCYAAARVLAGPGPVAVTAAAAPLAIPQLSHIGSTVNNDNLLTLLVGVLTVVVLYVARGDTSLRTGALVGFLSGLALLTKGFALVLPIVVGAGYLIGLARQRVAGGIRWPETLRSAGIAAALAGGLGGWWWVRNIILYGRIQPGFKYPPPPPPGTVVDTAFLLDKYREFMMQRFWGSLGWVEVNLSQTTVVNATWVLAVGVVLAFLLRRRPDVWWRADLLLLLLPALTIGVVVWYGAFDYYARTGWLAGMQGRYLFPAVPGAAAVFALGLTQGLGRLRVLAPALVVAAAVWLQLVAARAVLFHYYNTPENTDLRSLRVSGAAVLAWSPWPPAAVLVVGLATAGAGAWVAVTLLLQLRAAARSRSPSVSDPSGAEEVPGVGAGR